MAKKRKSKLKKRTLLEPTVAKPFGSSTETESIGSSGTDIIGGMYREEFLLELQGQRAADVYDKMRRREAQISMILEAILNPIYAAHWSFEIEDETDPAQAKMKELCEWNFHCGLQDGFKQHLREVFTFPVFGFALFECVHATENVPELDNALVTYYKKFGFRKQSTIQRWKLERKTGAIISVVQQTFTDVSKDSLVDIPGEFLLVFTNKKEGDNYEGISALRPMYGAYARKDMYLKITAIGADKFAVGTVIGTVPAGKSNTEQEDAFEEVLEAYATHESQYIKVPEGWKIEIQKGDFDPSKMVALLQFENEEMARSAVVNFLMLGNGGNSGAKALSTDLSSFFLGGIQAYADLACEVHNQKSIPALCEMNYGAQEKYPKLRCSGIDNKAGKELADILLALTNARSITPDSKLEDFLRTQYRLPPQDPETARQPPAPVAPFGAKPIDPNAPADPNQPADPAKPAADKTATVSQTDPAVAEPATAAERAGKRIQFAEGYKSQFNSNKAAMKDTMSASLRFMADNLKDQLVKNWNALGDATKANAIKNVAVRGGLVADYKNALRAHMADTATQAIAQARKEAPAAAAKVKFDAYDKLNPLVKRAIESQLGLIVDTQVNDLTKVVLFQWSSSSASQSNVDAIANDVEAKVAPILDGSTASGMSIDAAAGDAVAHITQGARNAFFFDSDVIDTIESFTFTNEDPVSEICQNLNGQTFLATDPNAEQFYPPLHHNCKSRLVPNEKGSGEKITGIGIVADSPEERERIAKQATLCDCGGHKIFS